MQPQKDVTVTYRKRIVFSQEEQDDPELLPRRRSGKHMYQRFRLCTPFCLWKSEFLRAARALNDITVCGWCSERKKKISWRKMTGSPSFLSRWGGRHISILRNGSGSQEDQRHCGQQRRTQPAGLHKGLPPVLKHLLKEGGGQEVFNWLAPLLTYVHVHECGRGEEWRSTSFVNKWGRSSTRVTFLRGRSKDSWMMLTGPHQLQKAVGPHKSSGHYWETQKPTSRAVDSSHDLNFDDCLDSWPACVDLRLEIYKTMTWSHVCQPLHVTVDCNF